jgi:beta-glucanase (GH16 family)
MMYIKSVVEFDFAASLAMSQAYVAPSLQSSRYANCNHHEAASFRIAFAHHLSSSSSKNHDLQLKSSKNTLYFSLSLCSSKTTNNRLPVKLFAATAADHAKTAAEENNHLILWIWN